jgi:hypothetical protein
MQITIALCYTWTMNHSPSVPLLVIKKLEGSFKNAELSRL